MNVHGTTSTPLLLLLLLLLFLLMLFVLHHDALILSLDLHQRVHCLYIIHAYFLDALERGPAAQHCVECDAKRPDIRGKVVDAS